MKKIEFKSQICTSIVQSKRLLELGLKKETADCNYPISMLDGRPCECIRVGNPSEQNYNAFPAWSLGRLIKDLMPKGIGRFELAVGSDYAGYYEENYYSSLGMHWEYVKETPDMFDNIISTIEWLIKEGFFNKDYLEEKNDNENSIF